MTEAYEEEANPSTREFWENLPKQKRHIFSKHPIMSVYGKSLSKKSFEHTNKRMGDVGGNVRNLMQVFQQIMQKERAHKEELESLAVNTVSEVWGIPVSMLEANITDAVDINTTKSSEDVELSQEMIDQINKRITINALTQGSAVDMMMTVHHLVNRELKKIDTELLNLYDKITSASHKQYWMMDISSMAKQLAGMAVGSEKVTYSNDTPKIEAKAIMFPILVQELSKGVMELLSHHGLSDMDEETTETVLAHADRLEDEPWLIQIGPEMWRKLLDAMPDKTKKADIVTALNKLPPKQMHDLIMKILDDPVKARPELEKLL
ncbi:MAG: hypothetical protein GF411_19955 [Candidatus Lokiarchaeota archaeon]|nr:hypothetical protein [Candidatus Lokiarchaeota archaeon]